MGYFFYRIPGTPSMFVGMAPSQIVETIDYYNARGDQPEKIIIPREEDIERSDSIYLTVLRPFYDLNQFIDAEIRKGFHLHINANSFWAVRAISRNFSHLKRGPLYKFFPGIHGQFWLPEFVMEGMRDYDWTQHVSQIDQFNADLNSRLEKLENRGIIIRTIRE